MKNSQLSDKQQLTQRVGGVKSKNQKKNDFKKVGSSYNISNKKSINLQIKR